MRKSEVPFRKRRGNSIFTIKEAPAEYARASETFRTPASAEGAFCVVMSTRFAAAKAHERFCHWRGMAIPRRFHSSTATSLAVLAS